jgi:hypothetical protein
MWHFENGQLALQANKKKCVDLPGNNYKNGNQLELWDCNGLPQQKWGYDASMKTIYLSTSSDASKCVDLFQGFNPLNGAPVQIWDCTGDVKQQWDVYQYGPAPPTPPTPPPPPPAPPPAWTEKKGLNCYQGHGATDLEPNPGLPCGTMSLAQCKLKCDDLPGCVAITMSAGGLLHQRGEQMCFRRADIDLTRCQRHKGNYNTYIKTQGSEMRSLIV